MTGYLLDTNVVSSFSPSKAGLRSMEPSLLAWFTKNEPLLYLSAVTILEIEAGLIKLGRTAPGRWHQTLSDWFADSVEKFTNRILPLNLLVARQAAALMDQNASKGLDPGLADVVIAATALANDMILLTRNLRHFAVGGLRSIDPFKTLPP